MINTPLIFICIDYELVEMIEKLLQLYYSADMLNTLVGGDGEYTALQWASYMVRLFSFVILCAYDVDILVLRTQFTGPKFMSFSDLVTSCP